MDRLTDQDLANAVQSLLTASTPTECGDHFTVDEVRKALVQDFDHWSQARAEMPNDGQRPLWGLIMHDGNWENAVFVAWVWEMNLVRIDCGMGDSGDVQGFCEYRAASDVVDLFEQMREKFRMSEEPISLPLMDVERWIDRKW